MTENNRLLPSDSTTPGTLLSHVAITGPAPSITERVEAIGSRPATGELYTLAIVDFDGGPDAGRILKIDPAMGQATKPGFPPPRSHTGADYAFKFDPVADVLRVVNTADQNFRVTPDTSALVMTGSTRRIPASSPAAGAAGGRWASALRLAATCA